jgi:peptidoglycan/xylan/chitin deacetylase (PgdA/CDA1 family)
VNKLRGACKRWLAGLCVGSGAHALWSRLRPPRLHVVGYHRVVDALDEDGPVNPSLCITTDQFRRQMRQAERHFAVLPLAEAVRVLVGERPLARDALVITFDDGYRDVLLRAQPVLAELGLPATVFVPTGYAGHGRALPHDRLYAALWAARRAGRVEAAPLAATVDALCAALPARALADVIDRLESLAATPPPDAGAMVLSPAELRALAESGWEIGAHTVGHVVLTHEPPARIDEELTQPRQAIERWTGRPCRSFAYCNGLHSARLREAVQRAGYRAAVTTCDRPNRPGDDPLRIARKVLWAGHARGPDGRWSATLSAANLHDLFGDLGLTRPVDGEVVSAKEVRAWQSET